MPDHSLHNHKELFRRLSEGDERAFTEIFLHYSRQLFPFVLKKLKSDQLAEEALQDIFLKLWLNRVKLASFENPEGWLYRVASNTILDHFRHMAHRAKMLENRPDKAQLPLTPSLYAEIDFNEAKKKRDEAVEQLPAQRKAIYELRQQGLTYEEISIRFNLSVNTVKNQLISANRSIREFLLAHGITPVGAILIISCL